MLAQVSRRVLLIGVKKIIAAFVPQPILQSWSDAETLLESSLNLNLPAFDRAQVKGAMLSSLREAEMKLKVMEKLGKLTNKSIAVFAIGGHRKWNPKERNRITFDRLPPLTRANDNLFMLRVSELHLEDCLKTLFRFLHPLERFAAQGLDPVAAGTYLPHGLLMKAASNANPPNTLAPYLCPIIHAIAEWGGLEAWPSPEKLVRPDRAAKKASRFKHQRPKAREVILKKPVGRPRKVKKVSLRKARAT